MFHVALACCVTTAVTSCSTIASGPDPVGESPSPQTSSETSPPTSTQTVSPWAPKPRTILHGPRSRNQVTITLDADYSPGAATRVENGTYPRQVNAAAIKYLEASKTPATVFVTGMWAQTYARELRRLADNPLVELGNHTWNHDAWTKNCYGLPYIGTEEAKREGLQQTNRIVEQLTGKTMRFARLPGLCHTKADERIIAGESLQSVDTDVSASDAFAENPRAAAEAMLRQAQPGSIFLMHLNGAPNAPVTAQVLRILVPGLKAKGLNPVTLGELL
jgi:peptidoglycan/xylan/chitin deacetylase (PgdA/CDA1 family)